MYWHIKEELSAFETFEEVFQSVNNIGEILNNTTKELDSLKEELQKIIAGKSTLRTFFTTATKEDVLERLEKEIIEV